jgi:hypothetical protein
MTAANMRIYAIGADIKKSFSACILSASVQAVVFQFSF